MVILRRHHPPAIEPLLPTLSRLTLSGELAWREIADGALTCRHCTIVCTLHAGVFTIEQPGLTQSVSARASAEGRHLVSVLARLADERAKQARSPHAS